MPKVVTQKYNITLRNPQTGEETVQVSTEEVGGVKIEQAMGQIWNELGLELVSKELLEAVEETKVAPDEDGAVPDQSPKNIQRRVLKQNPHPQQRPLHGNTPMPMPMNIPEKIIQHGDVRLKMIGDKVFIEEWVEKCGTDGYKIIDDSGQPITDSVVILHKEWVELKEEEKEEEKENEEPKKVVPNHTTQEDTNAVNNLIDNLIQNDD